jgi:hypothetical protein
VTEEIYLAFNFVVENIFFLIGKELKHSRRVEEETCQIVPV